MTDLFEGGEPKGSKPRAKKGGAKAASAPPPQAEGPKEGEVLPSAEARTELIVAEAQANPVALFTDEKRYSEFYEKVAGEVRGHVPDVSTAKGRDEIRALAFRVVKAKTSLDKAGLGLTEEWRTSIKKVNESRAKMTGELAALAEEVRAPLTAWEKAEEERLIQVEARLRRLQEATVIGEEETAAEVRERGRTIYGEALEPEIFGDRLGEAQAAKDTAVASLLRSVARLEQEEKDREELEALRREREERLERERLEREAQEKKEADEEEARRLAPSCVRIQSVENQDAEEVSPAIIRERLEDAELPLELEALVAEAAKPLWADHLRQLAERRAADALRVQEERRAAAEEAREEERRRAEAEREEQAQRKADEERGARALAPRAVQLQVAQDAKAEEVSRSILGELLEGAGLPPELEAIVADAVRPLWADHLRRRAEEAAEEARRTAADAERREEEAKRAREEADREREEEERKAREAREERERNQEHRRKVAGEAATAIQESLPQGMKERQKVAQAIVLAIAAGNVPHVTIAF